MKKIIVLSLAIMGINISFAANINFSDYLFKSALLNHSPVIDTNGDGAISTEEAEVVRSLYISGKNIYAINSDLQYFHSLEQLDCSNNNLSKVQVNLNSALKVLVCGNNPNLTELYLNDSIESISCNNTGLSGISLTVNRNLTYLSCYSNSWTNLNISNCLKLKTLNCSGNSLNNIDLSSNTELETLDIANNPISHLDLSANIKLKSLRASVLQLSLLDLQNNVQLTSVDCSSSSINTLLLGDLPELDYLACNSNTLEELNLSRLDKLRILNCNYNSELSEICVPSVITNDSSTWSKPTNARYINQCGHNQIVFPSANLLTAILDYNSTIDLNNDSMLNHNEVKDVVELVLENKNISSAEGLQYFKKLENLNISKNNLTKFDLRSYPAIVIVNASFNKLDSTFFNMVDAREDAINIILGEEDSQDISTNLKELYLDSNRLKSLDLSGLFSLDSLSTIGNEALPCVKVKDALVAENKWKRIDSHTSFNENCSITTSLFDIEETKCSVFPNPSSGICIITTESVIDDILIYDQKGRLVEKISGSSEQKNILIQLESTGLYYIQVSSGNSTQVLKTIIVK